MKTTTTIRLEPMLLNQVQAIAQAQQRSLSDIVREACREYVKRQDKSK